MIFIRLRMIYDVYVRSRVYDMHLFEATVFSEINVLTTVLDNCVGISERLE